MGMSGQFQRLPPPAQAGPFQRLGVPPPGGNPFQGGVPYPGGPGVDRFRPLPGGPPSMGPVAPPPPGQYNQDPGGLPYGNDMVAKEVGQGGELDSIRAILGGPPPGFGGGLGGGKPGQVQPGAMFRGASPQPFGVNAGGKERPFVR